MKIFGLAISARHRERQDILISARVVQCDSKATAIGLGITKAKELWSQKEYYEHQCSTAEVPQEWYMENE